MFLPSAPVRRREVCILRAAVNHPGVQRANLSRGLSVKPAASADPLTSIRSGSTSCQTLRASRTASISRTRLLTRAFMLLHTVSHSPAVLLPRSYYTLILVKCEQVKVSPRKRGAASFNLQPSTSPRDRPTPSSKVWLSELQTQLSSHL